MRGVSSWYFLRVLVVRRHLPRLGRRTRHWREPLHRSTGRKNHHGYHGRFFNRQLHHRCSLVRRVVPIWSPSHRARAVPVHRAAVRAPADRAQPRSGCSVYRRPTGGLTHDPHPAPWWPRVPTQSTGPPRQVAPRPSATPAAAASTVSPKGRFSPNPRGIGGLPTLCRTALPRGVNCFIAQSEPQSAPCSVRRVGGSPRAIAALPHQTEGMTHMTPSQPTIATDAARRASYRRLALTILALDVPTLASSLQSSHPRTSTMPMRQPLRRVA
jgi:hypothetical protein